MSLTASLGWTLLRAAIVALCGWPVAAGLNRWLDHTGRKQRQIIWFCLLAAFLFPALFTGYAYAGFVLRAANWGIWGAAPWGMWIAAHDRLVNELFYGVLLWCRVVPVGVVLLRMAPPPPVSSEAFYCRQLASRARDGFFRRMMQRLTFALRGPWRAALPAVALMGLIAFQEFELASLMQCASWTVWLFDAQSQGADLALSVRKGAWPAACQGILLIPLVAAAWKSGGLKPSHSSRGRGPSRLGCVGMTVFLVLAVGLLCVVPIVLTGRDIGPGVRALFSRQGQWISLLREIGHGLKFAVLSAGGALALAAAVLWWRASALRHGGRGALALVLSVPGLMGSLVVALLMLFVFQRTPLGVLYGTSVPAVAGLVIFLLPRAFVMQLVLAARRPAEATYLANLLSRSNDAFQRTSGRELLWRSQWRPQVFGGAVVAWWAYLELTLASLLAPAAMVPATVRLYNQMHFGKNAVLTAMTCVAVLVPVLAFVAVLFSRPLLIRSFQR